MGVVLWWENECVDMLKLSFAIKKDVTYFNYLRSTYLYLLFPSLPI